MRVKLQTTAPLNPLKVWLPLPPDLNTVTDLKYHISTYLPVLVSARVKAHNIVLVLDGFELLADSEVGVLRDGDLICIGLTQSSRSLAKRKAVDEGAPLLVQNIKHSSSPSSGGTKSLKRRREPVSSSSSSPSSGSESDSEDSDSDSESSSSSSSSPAVRISTEKLTASSVNQSRTVQPADIKNILRAAGKPVSSNAKTPIPVPPGLGKPSTHSRNKRRRLKEAHARGSLPAATDSAARAPALQAQTESIQSGSNANSDLAMLSLLSKNRNKKKHFKASFAQALPQKIVFGAAAPPVSAPTSFSSSSDSDSSSHSSDSDSSRSGSSAPQAGPSNVKPELTKPTPAMPAVQPFKPASATFQFQPRLIPPSERQAAGTLPAGMIVTSVDVEEGLASLKGKKEKKGKGKAQKPQEEHWAQEEWMDPESFYAEPDAHAASAPPAQPPATKQPSTHKSGQIDFAHIEKSWVSYPKFAHVDELQVGCVVGWWGLAINPQTFTPENLLTLARLTERTAEDITVAHILRPGTGAISFGRVLEPGETQAAEDETTEIYKWNDVQEGDWRLVLLS